MDLTVTLKIFSVWHTSVISYLESWSRGCAHTKWCRCICKSAQQRAHIRLLAWLLLCQPVFFFTILICFLPILLIKLCKCRLSVYLSIDLLCPRSPYASCTWVYHDAGSKQTSVTKLFVIRLCWNGTADYVQYHKMVNFIISTLNCCCLLNFRTLI